MDENLFRIAVSVIPVLGTIITSFLIPCIKANLNSAKLDQYKKWAALAVKAAEMIWDESGHGADKKAYAAKFLSGIFNTRKTVINEEQMNVLIEAAVKEMNEWKGAL